MSNKIEEEIDIRYHEITKKINTRYKIDLTQKYNEIRTKGLNTSGQRC